MPEATSPDLPVPASAVLADPELRATLDLGQPVALMLIAILHFLSDADDPRGIVAELVDALPSGSYLTVSHLTADFDPAEAAAAQAAGQGSGITYAPRSRAEVAAFFAGLDLVDPGVVPLLAWCPDDGAPEDPACRAHVRRDGPQALAGQHGGAGGDRPGDNLSLRIRRRDSGSSTHSQLRCTIPVFIAEE